MGKKIGKKKGRGKVKQKGNDFQTPFENPCASEPAKKNPWGKDFKLKKRGGGRKQDGWKNKQYTPKI